MKKLSNEDESIILEGFIRLLAPTMDETGRPELSQSINWYVTGARSWEKSLEKLAAKGSYHELIKIPTLAPNKSLEALTKAHAQYSKFMKSWQGIFVRFLPNLVYQISSLPRECSYSIPVEILRAICRDRNFWLEDPFFKEFCENHYRCYAIYGEEKCEPIRIFINDFVKDLYLRLREPKTRYKILEGRRSSNRTAKEYCKYLRRLFAVRTPINVIRVDLAYLTGTQVSIEALVKDLEHFHKNMRHKPKLFKSLLGYIEKIEFGLSKGLHVHVLLFFTSERQSNADVYLAREIGEYWATLITNGRGSYRNINVNKKRFETLGILGIGEIHADDERAINNLCSIVNYFCKVEQYIRPIANPKMKLLRRGVMPELIGAKRGRPRNSERNAELSNDISKTETISNEYIPHQSPSYLGPRIKHWF